MKSGGKELAFELEKKDTTGLKRKLKLVMTQLKEKLLSSFIAFEDQKDIDSYVHGIRTKAIKTFEKEGFPTKNWKIGNILH